MPPHSSSSAAAITRASKSNLALSFLSLPRDRRADITTFYAFCRVVDDIADTPGLEPVKKRAQLEIWRRAVVEELAGEPELAAAMREVIARRQIPCEHFFEILDGVEMDIEPAGFETWEDLRVYCYRVASAVGLVSIEIFGYRNTRCRDYAISLGFALQLTNILRDVGQDFREMGRIYLPRQDMARFGYTAEDLRCQTRDERFLALMNHEAGRACAFYEEAQAILPREDRRSMVAAEIMRRIYFRLLQRMKRDEFRVFEKRYALSALEKTLVIARSLF